MILEIWESFRRLPVWVQVWMAVVLVPVNLMPFGYWISGAPFWGVFAFLALGGMLANLIILLREQGFSKALAIPHVLFWGPLVVVIFLTLRDGGGADWDTEELVLLIVLIVDVISLAFDVPDAVKWLRGDREIA
ncbi:hypothetical protein [Shimia sp.]|uniref:hypothetical protein n=1 Tax=Shimia sp. TaxID=1954381 RepID=UPI0032986334